MRYSIQDFIQIIAALRDPNSGCPWDLKQNLNTMIPHLLEESYEVVEAIEKQDMVNLREELGDLLLQVVFLSQLAKEKSLFDFEDVVNDVSTKIIRRHPHVFADVQANNAEEALASWNRVKAQEHKEKGSTSILDNIPHAFPALMRAEKIQKRCAKVGFDWQTLEPVVAKVEEELQEVKAEITRDPQDQIAIQEEVGDLLFATVNLARHLKCKPEDTLRAANAKFERRFREVEKKLYAQNKEFTMATLEEMDKLWDEVKLEEKY